MMANPLPVAIDWRHPALFDAEVSGLLHCGADHGLVTARLRGRLVYLATPYRCIAVGGDGAWDVARSLDAGLAAARWARDLAADGCTAISPIVQAVEMIHADRIGLLDPLDGDFWESWCRPLLAASAAVIVPPIPGWRDSAGIWREVREALHWQKRVFLIAEGGD